MSNLVLHQQESVTVSDSGGTYTLEIAAELTGVHGDLLRDYCRLGLLGPDRANLDNEGVNFDENSLYEVRRIEHFRREFGADLQALPLICDLVREVERLRAELRQLRD